MKKKYPEKAKRPAYDAWLHWMVTNRCNLDCAYCNSDHDAKKRPGLSDIATDTLLETLDKTGKVFHISFTGGGEPFMVPSIIEACRKITQKHFVSLTTNLTSTKIKAFCQVIDPSRVPFILASVHLQEFQRRNLQETYINNFIHYRNMGFQIMAREVAYPPLLKNLRRLKKPYENKGIEIQFDPYVGVYDEKSYPQAYTEEELNVFHLDKKRDIGKFYHHGKLCNAGHNVGLVHPNGDVTPCYLLKNKIGNLYKRIDFVEWLTYCPFNFCVCPLHVYDARLFQHAENENLKTKNLTSILAKEKCKHAVRWLFGK